MRNFGNLPESVDIYSPQVVNPSVLGAALATTGMMGAFFGLASGALVVGAIEMAQDKPLPQNQSALIYGGLAAAFFFGIPGALLQRDGKV